MSDLLTNLKKLAEEYSKQLNEVREKIYVIEEFPKVQALAGKYFKFNNSYGAGSNWWVYTKILRVKDMDVWVDSFQEDSEDKIEFSYDAQTGSYSYTDTTRQVEISEKEYTDAYEALVKKIIGKRRK